MRTFFRLFVVVINWSLSGFLIALTYQRESITSELMVLLLAAVGVNLLIAKLVWSSKSDLRILLDAADRDKSGRIKAAVNEVFNV